MREGEGTACPCCGYRTLKEGWGSFEVCPICWWEDDGQQLANPLLRDGANAVSLAEAQLYFLISGVSDPRFSDHVRAPAEDEPDPDWRPLENGRDMHGGPMMTAAEPYWLRS